MPCRCYQSILQVNRNVCHADATSQSLEVALESSEPSLIVLLESVAVQMSMVVSDSPTEIPLAHLLADIGKDVELGL